MSPLTPPRHQQDADSVQESALSQDGVADQESASISDSEENSGSLDDANKIEQTKSRLQTKTKASERVQQRHEDAKESRRVICEYIDAHHAGRPCDLNASRVAENISASCAVLYHDQISGQPLRRKGRQVHKVMADIVRRYNAHYQQSSGRTATSKPTTSRTCCTLAARST